MCGTSICRQQVSTLVLSLVSGLGSTPCAGPPSAARRPSLSAYMFFLLSAWIFLDCDTFTDTFSDTFIDEFSIRFSDTFS